MKDDVIRLGQFLKYTGIAESGAQAREWIQEGRVRVDGEVEIRRGRQLADGMQVSVDMPDGDVIDEIVGDEPEITW